MLTTRTEFVVKFSCANNPVVIKKKNIIEKEN